MLSAVSYSMASKASPEGTAGCPGRPNSCYDVRHEITGPYPCLQTYYVLTHCVHSLRLGLELSDKFGVQILSSGG